MQTTSPPKQPKKPQPEPDHPPVVPGTHRQAMVFAAIVILATIAPLLLGFNIGNIVPRLPSLDWTLALDQRTAKLAEAIHDRKIIFIGGSNIRFGLDAAGLTRDLHMPVVNFGLHASLGMDVIADRAAHFIRPGDVVVFAPELSHFRAQGAADFGDDLRIDYLAEHPSPIDEKLQSFPTREWSRARSRCNRIRGTIEKKYTAVLTNLLASETGIVKTGKPAATPYTVDAIGPDGTIIFPRPTAKPYERWTFSDPPDNVSKMDLINSRGGIAFSLLQKACAEKHALLCVMPPLRLDVTAFDQAEILRMEQHWINFAVAHGSIEVMKPGETVLPIQYGYDTDYHLNDNGVKLMEPRIIAAMRRVLSNAKIEPSAH
jgi:hypothetical protein